MYQTDVQMDNMKTVYPTDSSWGWEGVYNDATQSDHSNNLCIMLDICEANSSDLDKTERCRSMGQVW